MDLVLPKSGTLFLHESPNLLTPRGDGILGICPVAPPAMGVIGVRGERAFRHGPVVVIKVAARVVKRAAACNSNKGVFEFIRHPTGGDEPTKVCHMSGTSRQSRP